MDFQVPQFIDIEDKIFGPLTWKQFVYLAGGAGLAYGSYSFLPWFLSIIAIPFFIALALALAFYREKVSNRPFIDIMESAFKYASKSKMCIWKQSRAKPGEKKKEPIAEIAPEAMYIPRISKGKLDSLSLNLETKKRP